ncbi:MAG: bifunctional phosphoglucose/phosphomannose isomerase [Chitinophagales bacterium]|nr:bifunctional phosphoglucose/phosphomannose isomerase [Chitinophagales bacterium]
MFDLIESFPRQLVDAVALANAVNLKKKLPAISNIVVSGLGGSGIGGHAVIELVADELNVPLVVNNSYVLPHFAGKETLIILSSYSGNTEETVAVAKAVKEKGLTAICITSGGKLKELAEHYGWDYLLIPSGMPPRCGFGYSVVFQLALLEQYGLISSTFKTKVQQAATLLTTEQKNIQELAKNTALQLKNKLFALFADQGFHSLVVRAKQQFNENSKSLCWANVFPEMNHNELVAWRGAKGEISVVVFRSNWENARNKHRIAFSKEVIAQTGAAVVELFAKGNSSFEQYFYHTHLTDWISFYLAEQQQYDPMEIEVLNKLKAHLAAID